jgi:hypothetical protein
MSYERQCVAAVQMAGCGVKRCSREALPDPDPGYLTLIPICSWHSQKAFRQFAARFEDENNALKRAAAEHECDGHRAVEQYVNESVDWQIERTANWRKNSLTYFIRCGKFIKIGASASPVVRLDTIRTTGGVLSPDGLDLRTAELIAVEPGGFPRERELHARFKHLRHTGEWFTEAPELTPYIESLSEVAA